MKRFLLLSIVIITAFTACSKINGGPNPHRDRLTKLLLKDTLQMYVGETRNVPLTISPSDYNLDSLKFTSSDTTIISISNTGVLSAKKVGLSTITISNLTSTESINTHITVVTAPIDSLKLGLIAYYPFNNSTADSSGLGNDGTGYNLLSVTDRFGNQNSAYHFDGTSSYVSIKDNVYMRLYATDFTQSAWVKLDDYNASYGSVILGKRLPGVADAGYTFSIGGYTSSAGFPIEGITHFGPGGGSANNALSTKAIPVNQWHMLSCVYSYQNKTLSIYIDGILDDITSNISAPNASVGAKIYIGRDDPTLQDNGYFIYGSLDDIRVYDRALTAKEINKLYTLTY
jgi:hypothetical protein